MRVAVVGLGYVGLTLAVALAKRGVCVFGYDRERRVVEAVGSGRPHLYEPGVPEALAEVVGHRLRVADVLPPEPVDAAVLCVSTPVDPATRAPNLEHLRDATRAVAEACGSETLVVVRSTVPVGTTRTVVLPELSARWPRVRLAFCPERTIQGQALRELEELPQVVGGLDDESRDRAVALFSPLARRVVTVSSLEAAETVKLVNNCHTDLIYAFGNEVALFAERVGVDPLEVIRAANVDYPRPDLACPGFVGGGCLTKDPYLLLASARSAGYQPWLVERARALNEQLPRHVVEHFLDVLGKTRGSVAGAQVGILGFAYKGRPATDDMRGAPVLPMLGALRSAGLTLVGHDVLVGPAVLRDLGVRPGTIEDAFAGSDAVLVLTDHAEYATLDVGRLLASMRRPAVLYDCWRVLDAGMIRAASDVRYASIGYG